MEHGRGGATARRARLVRNFRDGSVEAMVAGPEGGGRCARRVGRIGPRHAAVTRVGVFAAEGDFRVVRAAADGMKAGVRVGPGDGERGAYATGELRPLRWCHSANENSG